MPLFKTFINLLPSSLQIWLVKNEPENHVKEENIWDPSL